MVIITIANEDMIAFLCNIYIANSIFLSHGISSLSKTLNKVVIVYIFFIFLSNQRPYHFTIILFTLTFYEEISLLDTLLIFLLLMGINIYIYFPLLC